MDASKLPVIPDDCTIPSRLKDLAEAEPDKPAFVFIDIAWHRVVLNRRDVWDSSRRFAGELNRQGVRKGDAVCNCLVNSPERLLTTFGTIIAGAAPLHGQVLLADGEDFFHVLRKSQCTTVILDPSVTEGAIKFLNSIRYTDEISGKDRYKDVPHLVNVIQVNVCGSSDDDSRQQYDMWRDSLSCEILYECEDIKAEDTAWIFVTSGTTGFSKMVPQTHKSILNFGIRFSYGCGVQDENSIYFNDRSLGWMAGCPIEFPAAGCTRVLANHRLGLPRDLGAFIYRVIVQEKCECGFIVPYCLHLLQSSAIKAEEEEGGKPVYKLRHVGTGGGPLSDTTVDCLGVITDGMTVVYGSTECGFMCWRFMTTRDDFVPFCVGTPCPGVEVRVVDADLRDAPRGQTGEVIFRSVMNTNGYLNDPEKSKSAIVEGGWFRLGDRAYYDEEGQLYVFSRQSDAIMRGPIIHYPGWMEMRIAQFPGVQAAVLVGVPDQVMHEEICAFVVPARGQPPTEESLRQLCQEVFVAAQNSDMVAVPKYFLFIDEIPTNQNGKIQRSALKEEARKRLKL